jgi:hypothetical protein
LEGILEGSLGILIGGKPEKAKSIVSAKEQHQQGKGGEICVQSWLTRKPLVVRLGEKIPQLPA